ncbi:hypothetical protein SteCoe_37047 [Stentor coeruleus]|uniref:Protein kinase domain-containing protein n=1 Tax=Stentor coeruleus TaxID=5963 RepID=A0A1R2ANW2_9CILI|nr:hypothetical protein SteCoe_37047 [Stentor coeruleus]
MASQSENHTKAFYQYLVLSKYLEEPVLELENIKSVIRICDALNQNYPQYTATLLQPYNSKFQFAIVCCINIEQLFDYLQCFHESMNYGVNFSDLLLSANSKFSELFLSIYNSVSWLNPNSFESIINILILLKKSKDLNIIIDTFYIITSESLLLYMSNLSLLYKNNENIEIYKKNLPRIRDNFKILDPNNNYYTKFQEYFKTIWLLSEDNVILDLTKIDETSIINEEDYFNVKLTIFKAKYTGELKNGITQFICIKKYTFKNSYMDLFSVKEEIKALKKMNDQKSDNNAFAAFYGSKYLTDSLYLYTEYHMESLWQIMYNCASANVKIPNTIIENCYTLVFTLSSLNSLNLVHGDINPHNILITDTLRFCLVDLSMLRHHLLSTDPKSFSKSIYSAPEIYYHKKKFSSKEIAKADIYSMGMVILQLAKRQELKGLNMIENDTQLKMAVASVDEPWISDLLSNMLSHNPERRLDGNLLTKFIPKKFTLPN